MKKGRGMLVIGGGTALAGVAQRAASAAGLASRAVDSLTEGLRSVGEGNWAATMLSLDLPGADLPLAERLAAEPGAGAVVLVADNPSASLAMEAMRRGARELLGAPVEAEALAALLEGLAQAGERVRLRLAEDGGEGEGEGGRLVGRSPSLLEVFKQVGRVAGSPATVLVTGESGTGKELVAQAIHRLSPRATRPFVAVNCAAIPEDLLESELFGHERGAFTGAVARKIGRFERASGGTLFLDEIGDMSLVLQAKILRALQEREIERLGGEERLTVDVRVVAATHRDLATLIAAGEFREDLFYRLAVVRLHLAPLRERREDVRELALHYGALFAREYGRPVGSISAEALERLEGHAWPGNVRELRNVMERAVLVAPGEVIAGNHVELDRPAAPAVAAGNLPGYTPTLTMAEVEALHITRVLAEVEGHLGRASEILGLHRNTVSRKAREYGIEVS
ncbi:MAG TPA: sigma-54 dependent transcriptional regulator [Longimicrobiaceae bacterium]